MPYVSVYVDIDLNEVHAGDLIEELQGRHLSDNQQKELIDMIFYYDKRKLDLFMNVIDRLSLLELEEMFTENSNNIKPSENQIKLF